MPRWKPDAVERLQAAAFDLFDEQGFERTTVAEIAQRAGLTQRTFFNHFGDKREVLFGLSSDYQQEILDQIVAAADGTPPLDVVVGALQAAADKTFEERRAVVTRRMAIVETNPELHERELSKNAGLAKAVIGALGRRGCDPQTALLAAGAAMLAQQMAMQTWTRPGETRTLRDLLSEALSSLRTTVGR